MPRYIVEEHLTAKGCLQCKRLIDYSADSCCSRYATDILLKPGDFVSKCLVCTDSDILVNGTEKEVKCLECTFVLNVDQKLDPDVEPFCNFFKKELKKENDTLEQLITQLKQSQNKIQSKLVSATIHESLSDEMLQIMKDQCEKNKKGIENLNQFTKVFVDVDCKECVAMEEQYKDIKRAINRHTLINKISKSLEDKNLDLSCLDNDVDDAVVDDIVVTLTA
jgi:hypothetical protein